MSRTSPASLPKAGFRSASDELLLLAKKIPERIRRRVLERPDAFRILADLDDREIDRFVREFAR
jgi:hypothetical protein